MNIVFWEFSCSFWISKLTKERSSCFFRTYLKTTFNSGKKGKQIQTYVFKKTYNLHLPKKSTINSVLLLTKEWREWLFMAIAVRNFMKVLSPLFWKEENLFIHLFIKLFNAGTKFSQKTNSRFKETSTLKCLVLDIIEMH